MSNKNKSNEPDKEIKEEQVNAEEIKEEGTTEETVINNAEAAAAVASEIEEEDAQKVAEKIANDIVSKVKEQEDIIEGLNDKIKRQMAEFDNFRKRTEKEKTEMFDIGKTDALKKILPIVDNFERGFATIPEDEKKSQFAVGMDMVYKQFVKMLEDAGVTPIEALGKEFNPDLHNAVQHIEQEDAGENVVVQEYEKGYMYKDTVLRHSMVVVAN